jgi:anaphase-promoting complex subunit 3
MTTLQQSLPKSSWKSLVEHYLNLNLYESAKFYAERLLYEHPSEEAVGLLATCYYRLGKIKQTYMILNESKYLNSPDNKYLFALVCVALSKYDEAEFVLHSNNRFIKYEEMTKDNMSAIPGGAAGLYLMGKICRRQQRKDAAVHYFKLALQVRNRKITF